MSRALLVAAIVGLLALTARPFDTEKYGGRPRRWAGYQALFYSDPATLSGTYLTELQAAMAVWSAVPGSAFRFKYGGLTPSKDVTDCNNYASDAYFDATLPSYALAITYECLPIPGEVIYERDVAFSANENWTTYDFRTVAIHELGHVLGLEHESSKPSIMDPYYSGKRHTLYPDDEDGVRFLYPAISGPVGVDLEASAVVLDAGTAGDVGPGDQVSASFLMKNLGTERSSSFKVSLFLTGSLSPVPGDPFLGSTSENPVDVGEVRTGRVSGVIPNGLAPGQYRVGVILDPTGATGDVNRGNNGAASEIGLRVDRPPLTIHPGYAVNGTLGGQGRDEFRMDLVEGTKLKIKSSVKDGAHRCTLFAPGAEEPFQVSQASRKASVKATVPVSGVWTLRLDSLFAGWTSYSLSTGAKALKKTVDGNVDGEWRLPVFVYLGSKVTVSLAAKGGLKPVVVPDIGSALVKRAGPARR